MQMNRNHVELSPEELTFIDGGDNDFVTALGIYAGATAGATGKAVISSASAMEAAGYSMTLGEAAFTATGAAIAVPTGIVAVGAADLYLAGRAGQEGYAAFGSVSSLASQYQSYGESGVSSWVHALSDAFSWLTGAFDWTS